MNLSITGEVVKGWSQPRGPRRPAGVWELRIQSCLVLWVVTTGSDLCGLRRDSQGWQGPRWGLLSQLKTPWTWGVLHVKGPFAAFQMFPSLIREGMKGAR